MNNKILDEAIKRCSYEYTKNIDTVLSNISNAIRLCPEIEVLRKQRMDIIFTNSLNNTKSNAENEVKRINERIEKLLVENKLPKDYLEPIYTCKECKDTGFVGSPKKELCSCVKKYYSELMKTKDINAVSSQSFENFKADIFSDSIILNEIGRSQRKWMEVIKSVCEKYANTLQNPEKPILILSGASGLGKTFLLNCIHNRAIEYSVDSIILSANKLLNVIREAYFNFNSEALDNIRDCELFLIDDFGTEPLWENISIEQILDILNYRYENNLPFAISTNLSPIEIKNRYNERLYSRLFDAKKSFCIKFYGDDVRKPYT